MREMRWRDRGLVVHAMSMVATSGPGCPIGTHCQPVWGAHRATTTFKHPKYCPLPVSCVFCLGYIPTLPR